MATVKVILRKKANSQQEYPIAIRVTRNRKTTYIYTGQSIDVKYWDETSRKVKKSHPSSSLLNHYILTKLTEVNKQILESEISKSSDSLKVINKKIKNNGRVDFFVIANNYLDELFQNQKFNQLSAEKSRIKIFKEFIGSSELDFRLIDVSLLKRFKTHLIHKKGKSLRTVMNYLLIIRTIYNRAINDKLIDANNYPFGKNRIQIKFPESEKIGLTKKEIKKLEKAIDLTPSQQNAVNLWLFSFYLAGIRIGDTLKIKWSDFKNGRLYYRMGKNQKLVSLKVPFKAKRILVSYKHLNNSNDLVFKELNDVNLNNEELVARRTHTITRNLNRRLKIVARKLKIDKNLTTHIARHSFGNISGDKIPIQTLQKLYRHSSVTTTINYQANFMKREADEALDKVVNF